MISFTIAGNSNVSKFLNRATDEAPTAELIYLHTHPLLRPNFLTEINDLVDQAGEKILQRGITGKPIEKLEQLAIQIGTSLTDPNISQDNAKVILLAIRDLYELCKKIG